MRYLSQVIVFMLCSVSMWAQSPHGSSFNINCDVCHSPESWDLVDHSTFDHDSTDFKLIGQHANTDCRQCHISLDFASADGSCISCHSDIHNNTVGQDCDQCHNNNNWIVSNVKEIHQNSRFPLVGAHGLADCYDCHLSASMLRFDPIGIECNDCHKQDYMATQNPSHEVAGFSTECFECHNMTGTSWQADGFEHGFFPLTQGHNLDDCAKCHVDDNYKNVSPECNVCHAEDYDAAVNPNHVQSGFSRECDECHTTSEDWKPASFHEHDASFFPIYSGSHSGEWESCTDCHKDPNNFIDFTCTDCHEHRQSSMDRKHDDVSGYAYNSNACYACHPTGREDGSFDHNTTNFPLTGAHRNEECLSCHTNGYGGTSMECNSCHAEDYATSQEPPHQELGIPTTCEECHTTNQGWEPATFAIHNEYHPLNGAHANIATDCIVCHKDGYTNTPDNCYGCHTENYAATTNPSHVAAGFSTDCELCHGESSWVPSTFNHDATYPLTGGHAEVKNNCILCHANGYTNTPNQCNECHAADYSASSDPPHASLTFPTRCDECHTTHPGWEPATFAIHNNYYVLQGAHANIASDCKQCHATGYTNTPTDCYGCHSGDYNSTTDPAHASAQFPKDCEPCHSLSAWKPSTFNHDGQYFPIYSGKHQGEWNLCADCHTNASNYSIFSCINCHEHNNRTEVDNDHKDENGYTYTSTSCFECHPQGRS